MNLSEEASHVLASVQVAQIYAVHVWQGRQGGTTEL